MGYLALLLNLLALLFWVRFWTAPQQEFYFNPLISGTVKLIDSMLDFMRPVLYMPQHLASLLLMLFVISFKALLFFRFNISSEIKIGSFFLFLPPPAKQPIPGLLIFHLLGTALFIVRVWTLSVVIGVLNPAGRLSRAAETLNFITRPFSQLNLKLRLCLLLVLHFILVLAISRFSASGAVDKTLLPENISSMRLSLTHGPLIVQLLKTAWLTTLSMADALMLLTRTLFALIIGNILAALTQARGAALICNEGVELILGRFSRTRATGAGFDFTPLIFFFAVDLLYNAICHIMFRLIHSPFLYQ